MISRFGPFSIEPAAFELRRDGTPVQVEPQTFELISYLVENRARVVTKDELLEHIWRGRAVSDWAISAAIKSARLVLQDSETPRRYIRTIHSKGVRFVADVSSDTPDTAGLPPSLLVLPLEMQDPNPGQSYFAEGLTEDLITDLSRVDGLRIATRNAALAGTMSADAARSAMKTLGASHVLDGSVRRDGNAVRVTARLMTAPDRQLLWTDRFTASADGIFALQDDLCDQIVAALTDQLTSTPRARRPGNAQAYDRCLMGRSEYYRYAPPHMARALEHFEAAAELDPEYAEAYSYQSYCRTALHVFAWPGSDATLDPALALANRAVKLDGRSAVAQARRGWVLGYLGDAAETTSAFEAALSLDDGNAEVLFAYGETLNRLGQPDRALDILQRAFAIESFVPPSWEFGIGHSHTLKKNYGAALNRFVAVLDRVPKFLPARVQLARLQAEMGAVDDARATVRAINADAPKYCLFNARRMFPYPQETERQRLEKALKIAGLP